MGAGLRERVKQKFSDAVVHPRGICINELDELVIVIGAGLVTWFCVLTEWLPRYADFDQPNALSSHDTPTLRGADWPVGGYFFGSLLGSIRAVRLSEVI